MINLNRLGTFFTGFSIGFILLVVVIQLNHPFSFSNLISTPVYNYVTNYEIDNEVVKNISSFCGVFSGEEVVDCVVTQIGWRWNDTNLVWIRTADEVKREGMVCRDFAVFASAVFRSMGYSTEFRFLPWHVYLTVHNHYSSAEDQFSCEVNNGEYKCW